MRLGPGIRSCLLGACLMAGCVTQPTTPTSQASPSLPLAAAANQHVLRIGLEFLPPDERFANAEPLRAEPLRSETRIPNNRPPSASERAMSTVALRNEPSLSLQLNEIDFASIDDPIEREAMRFCSDLIAADRQRVKREVGIPIFGFRYDEFDFSPLLTSERRLLEEHAQWSQQRGPRLLRRPLQQLAKRLPVARDFDIIVEDFRSDHVPLSEPYRQAHGDRKKFGRLSVRLHLSDLKDPTELVYIHPSGVRVGSSQEYGKLSLDFGLTDTIRFQLRGRTNYEDGTSNIRSDLIYRPKQNMSVHLAAGDNMDFLSTSSIYSLFESPMDGSPGLVLYAVHTF